MAKQQKRPASPPSASNKSARSGRKPDAPTGPQAAVRSTYVEAVALYEQAIRTLQEHRYAKAADLLRHVLEKFPEERELAERVRLYLGLCERHLTPLAAEPANSQERLYAATLALNAGHADTAVRHLERVLQDEPDNDQALYMLAIAHAERGEREVAIPYLRQAIERNPENRALARLDPDLDSLRHDEAVLALLEAPAPTGPPDARRTGRQRR